MPKPCHRVSNDVYEHGFGVNECMDKGERRDSAYLISVALLMLDNAIMSCAVDLSISGWMKIYGGGHRWLGNRALEETWWRGDAEVGGEMSTLG